MTISITPLEEAIDRYLAGRGSAIDRPYGSGQFIKDLTEHFDDDDRVVTSEIKGKDAIMDSIKEFLGKGR